MDHEAALGRLSEGVDGLLEVDAAALSDDELSAAVIEAQRESERLAAARAALVSQWDARQSWAADGAKTGAAWLAAKCRMSKASARREVRRARTLRHMPVASEALAAGEIGVDHLDTLTRVRREPLSECFARDERQLVGHAKRLPFHHFHKAGAGASRLRVCAFGPGSTRSDAHASAGQRHRGSGMDCVSV